ncbi:hypothetical protein KIW84_035658 [Lathyrus oleraceus]|uniref:Putative plant transposon protein domain-containing protein n=1 Tax=Pisum sativum TaxID=3888 RepID=A0A9D4Y282_PEA|nr:hypothetical protein KIW84_035658 [Pisum sativum]
MRLLTVLTQAVQGDWLTNNLATRRTEMKTGLLQIICANPFAGLDHANPYTHLTKIYELDGMALKRDMITKKQKTSGAGTSRGKESFDKTKFLGQEQQDRYQELIGRSIWDVINEFLGNPLVLREGQMCRYQESINKVSNVEEISRKIILDGREVERNPFGVAIRYRREDLIPEDQVLLLFILHNIRPRSHTSVFIMDMTQLLYLIMSGKQIDVAQIVVNEMRHVAESGKEFGTGTRSTCPLVSPGLIMGLLIASRVRIPIVVPFEIKAKVNDTYVDRFCLEKKKKRREVEKTGKTSSNTLNYGDWDPRLRQAFTYTWDQNDSNHRADIYLHDSFFRLHIQSGGKPDTEEAASHRNENKDDKKDAEEREEEGTSGGSKTTSDDDAASGDDEEMRGE